MLYRVTQKVAKKLGVAPTEVVPAHPDPFADWTANLFRVNRRQVIIVTNTVSLYSVLMPGAGVTDPQSFHDRALRSMIEMIQVDGILPRFKEIIAPHVDSVKFSKTGDRRVLGSMNDLIFMAKVHLGETGRLPLIANALINDAPMSILKYVDPRVSFQMLSFDPADHPDVS